LLGPHNPYTSDDHRTSGDYDAGASHHDCQTGNDDDHCRSGNDNHGDGSTLPGTQFHLRPERQFRALLLPVRVLPHLL
jgi:hypothetical protein